MSNMFIEPGAAYANVDRVVAVIAGNPETTEIGLTDLFENQEAAAAFLNLGFGPNLAAYFAEKAAKTAHHTYKSVIGSVDWSFLESFDPITALRLPPNAFHTGPLDVSRNLLGDWFDPARSSRDDYGIGGLSHDDQIGVLTTLLFTYAFICSSCYGVAAAS